jgi:type IV pilus assembly protein PilN
MYSLDINFLNDRPEYKPEAAARTKAARPAVAESKQPLYLGLLAAILLPGLALGGLLYLQSQNAELDRQDRDLESKLGALKASQQRMQSIRNEIALVRDETQALASVFNQIKPWSAMMQDLRDRIPPNVQVTEVKQLPPPAATAAPTPAASPQAGAAPANVLPPSGSIQVSGVANTFSEINDFLLLLQKSNFLKADATRIVTAELTELQAIEQISIEDLPQESGDPPKLPRQVRFQIETALSDVPASELLRELDRKGAAGLVTRIESLQQKGVIQP